MSAYLRMSGKLRVLKQSLKILVRYRRGNMSQTDHDLLF